MKKVTNVWNLEWLKEQKQYFAVMARPQDWGDPRWKYAKFTFIDHEFQIESEVHCWLDTSYKQPEQPMAELFASLIAMVLQPGTPVNQCSNQYLAEEDFWQKAWGKQPPWIPDEEYDF